MQLGHKPTSTANIFHICSDIPLSVNNQNNTEIITAGPEFFKEVKVNQLNKNI
jgi:hypothetical protein